MEDRSVEFPNRYQLKKVEGTDDIYDLIPAPGTITTEGTLINKKALLQDATAELFQLSGDNALPDKVFEILSKAALVGEDGGIADVSGEKILQGKIETGTYVGTGVAGIYSKHNSISFSLGMPKICFIFGYEITSGAYNYMRYSVVLDCDYIKEYIGKVTYLQHYVGVLSATQYNQPDSWSFYENETPNTIEWASGSANAAKQMNENGIVYKYYAFY